MADIYLLLAVFILEDALSVWTKLGKHLLFNGLCNSSVKTGTRRIMRLDELSSVAIVCCSRRKTEDSSSRRIMRLVPVFRDLKHRRRRRQRERQETIVLISKTLALHVHYTLWYVSLPSSAKQRREMTKFKVLWRT